MPNTGGVLAPSAFQHGIRERSVRQRGWPSALSAAPRSYRQTIKKCYQVLSCSATVAVRWSLQARWIASGCAYFTVIFGCAAIRTKTVGTLLHSLRSMCATKYLVNLQVTILSPTVGWAWLYGLLVCMPTPRRPGDCCYYVARIAEWRLCVYCLVKCVVMIGQCCLFFLFNATTCG